MNILISIFIFSVVFLIGWAIKRNAEKSEPERDNEKKVDVRELIANTLEERRKIMSQVFGEVPEQNNNKTE